MNRRHFLAGLGALVGGLAIEQAIPLGRVWSFPTTIQPRTLNFSRDAFTFADPYVFVPGDIISFGSVDLDAASKLYTVTGVHRGEVGVVQYLPIDGDNGERRA